MAVRGALLVDGPRGLLDCTASLSPRPTNRDSRGNDDGPGGRDERPEDRRGHEGQPVTQTTKQSMHQLFSSPSRGTSVQPADAKIINAHRRKTDDETNPTDSPFFWSMAAQGSRCGKLVNSRSGQIPMALDSGRHPGAVPGVGTESMIPSSTAVTRMCRSLVRSSS
jgi:hypothetical protein